MNKDFAKPVIIVIPWMVLQELDVGLHQKAKPGQSLAQMRRPVQYIHSLLASNHPKIKGQKAYEAAISKLKFDEIVADDSILNCAVQNLKINTTVVSCLLICIQTSCKLICHILKNDHFLLDILIK